MRNLFIASFTILALGACGSTSSTTGGSGTTTGGGSGTTTGGGGSTTGACTIFDGGQTIVTFTTVAIHPAAVAALNDAGFPVPSINQGDYVLVLDGVSVNLSLPDPIVLTDAGIATITSTDGPYVFELSAAFFQSQAAQLGVAGVVHATARNLGDGGIVQPTCAQFATIQAGVQGYLTAGQSSVIPDYLLDAGFPEYDSVVDTGLEVGGQAIPPICDVHDAVAYAIPLTYAVMLNCAGNPTKATRDTDEGEAIAYITDGTGPGQGSPVAGATVSVINAMGNPVATYYANNYTMSNMTGPTDSTGVATFLGIEPAADKPPTMSVKGVPGYTTPYAISTVANSFFSILAYPH